MKHLSAHNSGAISRSREGTQVGVLRIPPLGVICYKRPTPHIPCKCVVAKGVGGGDQTFPWTTTPSEAMASWLCVAEDEGLPSRVSAHQSSLAKMSGNQFALACSPTSQPKKTSEFNMEQEKRQSDKQNPKGSTKCAFQKMVQILRDYIPPPLLWHVSLTPFLPQLHFIFTLCSHVKIGLIWSPRGPPWGASLDAHSAIHNKGFGASDSECLTAGGSGVVLTWPAGINSFSRFITCYPLMGQIRLRPMLHWEIRSVTTRLSLRRNWSFCQHAQCLLTLLVWSRMNHAPMYNELLGQVTRHTLGYA